MPDWSTTIEFNSRRPDAREQVAALIGNPTMVCEITGISEPGITGAIAVDATVVAESPAQAMVTVELHLALNVGVEDWVRGTARMIRTDALTS